MNVGALGSSCHVTAAGVTAGRSAQRWNLPGTQTGTQCASNDTSVLVLFLFLGCRRSRCRSFLLVGVCWGS